MKIGVVFGQTTAYFHTSNKIYLYIYNPRSHTQIILSQTHFFATNIFKTKINILYTNKKHISIIALKKKTID